MVGGARRDAHCLAVHWHSIARGFGAMMPSDGLVWLDLGSVRLTSAERLWLIVFFWRIHDQAPSIRLQRWLSEKLDFCYPTTR